MHFALTKALLLAVVRDRNKRVIDTCYVSHIFGGARFAREKWHATYVKRVMQYCTRRHMAISQCNKRQARAQNFFAPISINLVPKVV